jgi:uncharacterized protein (UPF0548 family)
VKLTYDEVGASRRDPMPEGYRHRRYQTFLGYGEAVMRAAAHAVLSFDMYRAIGLDAVVDGDVVVVKIGPLRAPCLIVWREDSPRLAGFTYGTLPGHPVRGEETFRLTRGDDDRVWLEIRSFSLPARWYMRLAGPVMPLLQREFARRCGRALRRLVQS